jgi:parallel beta-helix repeat protein
MYRSRRSPALLAAAALVPLGIAASATGATVHCVNRTDRECQAAHPTITAAVAAASAGDVVLVGAGLYAEAVLVDKTVHLLGARAGLDARRRTDNPAAESIVDGGGTGTSTIIVQAPGVLIDGFTVQGGTAGNATGIDLKGTGGGTPGFSPAHAARVVNNIVQDNNTGLSLNSEGFGPVSDVYVAHNLFRANNAGPPASGGDGMFTSACTDVVITENTFTGHLRLAVGINNSTDVSVSHNESDGDARFAVVTGTTRSQFTHNTIRNLVPSVLVNPARAAAISIRFGNSLLTISHNVVGPGQPGAALRGIQFGGDSAAVPVNSALTVAYNTIRGMPLHGIQAVHPSTEILVDSRLIGNVIANNGGDGITLQQATGNVLVENRSQLNRGTNCRDSSAGAGTAGTANLWLKNSGFGSVPPGLCGLPQRR